MADLTAVHDLEQTPHAEVFAAAPRTVRLRLEAGEAVPTHRHPGEAVLLYGIEGVLKLRLDEERYDLRAGDAIRFSGEREISPRAVEDATALVVFAPAE